MNIDGISHRETARAKSPRAPLGLHPPLCPPMPLPPLYLLSHVSDREKTWPSCLDLILDGNYARFFTKDALLRDLTCPRHFGTAATPMVLL